MWIELDMWEPASKERENYSSVFYTPVQSKDDSQTHAPFVKQAFQAT